MNPSEKDCRKPAFKPGVTVVLADGGAWHFPRPCIRRTVHVDAATGKTLMRSAAPGRSETFGDRLDALDGGGDDHFFTELTALALELLADNYEIPPSLVPTLFYYEVGSQSSAAMWGRIRAAVCGWIDPPKAGTPGSS